MFDGEALGWVEVAEEVSGLSHDDVRGQGKVLARESILVKGIVSWWQTVGVRCDVSLNGFILLRETKTCNYNQHQDRRQDCELRMTDQQTIQFTFAVNDPQLEDAERQEIARKLLRELRQLDEVENVDFAKDSKLEAGAKSALATIVGVLTAEVSIENIQKVLGFIGDRIPNKPIVIKVKVGDREVEIEAKSRKELEDAERVARQLLEQMQESDDA